MTQTGDLAPPAGGGERGRAGRSRRSRRPRPQRLHPRVAGRRRGDLRRRRRRARLLRGRGDARRRRRLCRARVHRRAHAPRDHQLLPSEFARLVLPLGTTAVVADPHEIANVLGTDGVHWLVDVCADLPLDVFFTASSCVPASQFESPRRPFTPGDLESLLRRRRVIGLAEMMNFPGVIAGADSELAKLAVARGHRRRPCAGRARPRPAGVRRRRDPLRPRGVHGRGGPRAPGAGMWLLIREASAARNLRALAPLVTEFGPIADGVLHRRPRAGAHRRGRAHQRESSVMRSRTGVAPEDALVMASHHPALWHELGSLGAIAPGYQADLLLPARPRALRPRDRAQARPRGR